jgi:hypothetical protein
MAARSAISPPKLLSGGNPQIAKGDGDAVVQAYIAAMPGWKQAVGRRIDALIKANVPGVQQAVKWNSPFYGAQAGSWFLSLHCYDRFVRVAFLRGALMDPPPPGSSKVGDTRYFDRREDVAVDEAQLADWIRQASRLPGETM